ncbi:MAG: hypothetical protein ACLP0J_20415 [Solirubrobacteraceae bacterium]
MRFPEFFESAAANVPVQPLEDGFGVLPTDGRPPAPALWFVDPLEPRNFEQRLRKQRIVPLAGESGSHRRFEYAGRRDSYAASAEVVGALPCATRSHLSKFFGCLTVQDLLIAVRFALYSARSHRDRGPLHPKRGVDMGSQRSPSGPSPLDAHEGYAKRRRVNTRSLSAAFGSTVAAAAVGMGIPAPAFAASNLYCNGTYNYHAGCFGYWHHMTGVAARNEDAGWVCSEKFINNAWGGGICVDNGTTGSSYNLWYAYGDTAPWGYPQCWNSGSGYGKPVPQDIHCREYF